MRRLTNGRCNRCQLKFTIQAFDVHRAKSLCASMPSTRVTRKARAVRPQPRRARVPKLTRPASPWPGTPASATTNQDALREAAPVVVRSTGLAPRTTRWKWFWRRIVLGGVAWLAARLPRLTPRAV